MSKWKLVIHEGYWLIKNQFLGFLPFFAAIFLIRLFPLGVLLSLAFVNGEWAVRWWVHAGYPYWLAFLVCSACGNIDLAMWFLFFGRWRYVLEHRYPRAGAWLVAQFDVTRHAIVPTDGSVRRFIKMTTAALSDVAKQHKYLGLFLMGLTPFCGIVIGVPTSIGYKVRYGYVAMAAGNTVKIIAFGWIISHQWLYLSCLGILILIIFRHKLKPLLR